MHFKYFRTISTSLQGNYNRKFTIFFNFTRSFMILNDLLKNYKSSLSNLSKTNDVLNKLNEIIENKTGKLVLDANEGTIMECYFDRCKIVDSGPGEICLHFKLGIYTANWNERNPDKEWVDTEMIVALIKEWRSFLIHAENLVLVGKQHVKDDYLKSLDA